MKGIVHMDSLEPGLGSHSAVAMVLECQVKAPTFWMPYWFCLLHDHGNSGRWRWLSTLESVSPAVPWISLFPLLASSQESQPFLLSL